MYHLCLLDENEKLGLLVCNTLVYFETAYSWMYITWYRRTYRGDCSDRWNHVDETRYIMPPVCVLRLGV